MKAFDSLRIIKGDKVISIKDILSIVDTSEKTIDTAYYIKDYNIELVVVNLEQFWIENLVYGHMTTYVIENNKVIHNGKSDDGYNYSRAIDNNNHTLIKVYVYGRFDEDAAYSIDTVTISEHKMDCDIELSCNNGDTKVSIKSILSSLIIAESQFCKEEGCNNGMMDIFYQYLNRNIKDLMCSFRLKALD